VLIIELEWDDENEEHILRHNVNTEEVGDVCFGLNLSERESNSRYILSGQTRSGRYLNIVIERIGKGIFRPITAYEMDNSYKARYRKRTGK
jgi:uncharacterized DUF497 family protein